MLKRILILLILILSPCGFAGTSVSFSSPVQQTLLLELYTSEGCSSCPPADRWLSTLKDDPRLWKEIIPVAFHVDYWNYLGWKDKFSRSEFTQRQKYYTRWSNLSQVYTPGLMKNGKEWRGWFRNRNIEAALGEEVGSLTVTISEDIVTASFKATREIKQPVFLNVAWMGFDLLSDIRGGENEGKVLKHDFVAYFTDVIKGSIDIDTFVWKFDANIKQLPENRGAVFWITSGSNPMPIQATGGWIKKE